MSTKLLARGRKKSCAALAPKHKRSFADGSSMEPFFYAGQKYIGEPRVLYADVETAPLNGFAWQRYDTDLIRIQENTKLLCMSYRWHHEKRTHVIALPDFKGYRAGIVDDRELAIAIRELMDKADAIIAHNGDRFDCRKINGRLFAHGLTPPRPYITLDTLKIARKFLALDSYKMGDICRFLGIGAKLSTHGVDTWLGCMQGDPKAWAEMRRYSKRDTDLLPLLTERLLPWVEWKPNRRKPIQTKT